MSEENASSEGKGYTTLEYADEEGGQVGSLSSDELYEVLGTVPSGEMAEQIQRSYKRRQK